MKPARLLALLLASGCTQASTENNATAARPYRPPATLPSANLDSEQIAIVDRIERDIRLPRAASPLASYARYYAWQRRPDGARKVIGVYMNGGMHDGEWQPGRYWAEESRLPMLVDGGCARVTLGYDVASQRIEEISCNGAID